MDAVSAFDAGFTAQVSVMPPGAKVAPNSKLSEKDAGKAPAVKGRDGQYHGYAWMKSRPSRQTVEYWVGQGSSIGFLASDYPAIDIDITNEDIARAVENAVVEAMGPCLVRVGQAPKSLLIFRCDEPLRSFDMHYERWSELLGAADKHLIQFLGQGRQYVMYGNHPRTMQPYQIHDPACSLSLLGPAALPTLTSEKVVELFDIINKVMERFGFTTSSNAEARVHGGEVDQADLKAPAMTDLASLVERTPNTLPDRDDYISMGYAIKAASQDDPELGFDIFADWCERWDQGGNDPAIVRQDWDKMVPPYRMGWDWLMHKAGQLGADISDFRFGPAEAQPVAGQAPLPSSDPDPEVAASQAALQAASADADAVLSDRWLAKKFVQVHGRDYMIPVGMDTSYCYKWTGQHWEEVTRGELEGKVGAFLASHTKMAREAYENPKEGAAAAMRLGSYRTIKSVYAMAIADNALTPKMDQLDADPDLLDTPAGPIHLPTGELLKPKKEYLLTKPTSVPMDPTMHCPRWMRFIEEVTLGDRQLAFYLQCLAGYALTGHTREQIFPFFIGNGGNGKSKYLWALQKILGPNAVSLPVELFQLGRQGSDTAYQLARLHGARLVTTTETKAGGMWDEQRVKQVTGEDDVQGRHPFGKPFSFEARCTLIVAGNHAPDLEEVTDAMSRRIRVVPWDFKPEEADLHLEEKLAAELPGIFAWCVQGAIAWYQHAMPNCPAINDVTGSYLDEQDSVTQWLNDVLIVTRDAGHFLSNKELYDSYAAWCRLNGTDPFHRNRFGKRVAGPLRKKGLRKHRTSMERGWSHGQLKPVQDAPPNVVQFPAVAQPPPKT